MINNVENLPRLRFDYESRRFAIGDRELHCGNVIELFVVNRDGSYTVQETRIEHSDACGGWYFVHVQPRDPWQWTNYRARRVF